MALLEDAVQGCSYVVANGGEVVDQGLLAYPVLKVMSDY